MLQGSPPEATTREQLRLPDPRSQNSRPSSKSLQLSSFICLYLQYETEARHRHTHTHASLGRGSWDKVTWQLGWTPDPWE